MLSAFLGWKWCGCHRGDDTAVSGETAVRPEAAAGPGGPLVWHWLDLRFLFLAGANRLLADPDRLYPVISPFTVGLRTGAGAVLFIRKNEVILAREFTGGYRYLSG